MTELIHLILGGARSGKSRYAESLMHALPSPWAYLATAEAFDDEMAERIAQHKARRDERWQTTEAPRNLPDALSDAPRGRPVLIDCLTLWLSNLLLDGQQTEPAFVRLESALRARVAPTIVVSNEVGWGLVPTTELGRAFRDAQGWLNQRMAALAHRVELVAAGLPMRLK